MLTNETHTSILELINNKLQLPSPPAIAVRILDTVQKNESALAELGEIISADPVLSARMLKVANSGFFTGNGQITSIQRAMTVLGTNLIKNIALSFIIARTLTDKEGSSFDFDLFWRRSVLAAVAAEILAETLKEEKEDIFISALLKDIGMLVLTTSQQERYQPLLNDAELFDQSLYLLEEQEFGFNHQQVGFALLQNWHLPIPLIEPLLYHHKPEKASPDSKARATLLSYAGRIAALYSSPGQSQQARELHQLLEEQHKLSPLQTTKLLDDVAHAGTMVMESFELDPGKMLPYSEIVQRANQELMNLNISQAQMILELRDARNRAEQLTKNLQEANTRLRELVYRDGLTGLYNHRYFQETFKHELARARRYHGSVSLIIFDIDHFKKVNDSYGHPAGDLVLMNIARAVSSSVRPSDIVARYGGEEFAVILPETNAAGAKVFSARLRRCVEGIATQTQGQLIYVTVSIGTTTYTADTMANLGKDQLIESADRALYLSKHNGRNQVTALSPTAAVA